MQSEFARQISSNPRPRNVCGLDYQRIGVTSGMQSECHRREVRFRGQGVCFDLEIDIEMTAFPFTRNRSPQVQVRRQAHILARDDQLWSFQGGELWKIVASIKMGIQLDLVALPKTGALHFYSGDNREYPHARAHSERIRNNFNLERGRTHKIGL